MANMIKLFESNVYRNKYSHGFNLIEVVTERESIAEKVVDIISEDGVDAVLEFKKGLELNKINFDLEATDEENLYVCIFNLEKGVYNSETCMGVYTKTEMVEYLKEYVQQKLKDEVFQTLDKIQELMKNKERVSLYLELFDYSVEEPEFEDLFVTRLFPDIDNMSISVNAYNGFSVKFIYNYRYDTYITTITKKEEGEYEFDDLTEAYGVFSSFFPNDEWEEVIDPMKEWIEENQ